MPFVLSTPRGVKTQKRGAQKGLPPAKKQVPQRQLPALKAAAKANTPKKAINQTAALNDLFNKRLKEEQAITSGDVQAAKKATREFKTTHAKLQQAGFLGAPKKGVLKFAQKFTNDIENAAIYAPYGLYEAGKAMAADEYYGLQGKRANRTTNLLQAMGKAQYEQFRHPIRSLQQHPGDLALSSLAILSGGAGLASRVSAAGEAARAAGAAGEGGALRAALTRPSHEGGSLLRKPAPRETELIWRGAMNEDRQQTLEGNHPSDTGELVIHRLEPDNPILRVAHRARNRALQKQLDTLAAGKQLPKDIHSVAIRHLLGLDAPATVGREVRAISRVHPELGKELETQIPQEWVKKIKGHSSNEALKNLRKITDQFRFFGVYMKPSYITTNYLGNAAMGVATQGVAKVAANMYRARRMMKTHGEELTKAVEHDMGISRTESYRPEVLKGETPAGGPTVEGGRIRQFQNRWTNIAMHATDVDFRRASWQYRAREKGFNTVEQQRELLTNPKYAKDRVAVARRARKDAVDFDSLSPLEKNIAEGVFFYPWMSRATVWTGRTVLNRPVKSAVVTALSQQGKAASQRELGDQPKWMRGYIKTPFGVINPKSVLAPSTPGDVISQGKDVARGMLGMQQPGETLPSFFEEFGTPPFALLSGGRVNIPSALGSTVPVATAVRLGFHPFGLHPPKTFPKTGVKEAALPLIMGGLAFRQADKKVYQDQAKRERMREASPIERLGLRTQDRIAKIPAEVKLMAKAGFPPSQSDIASYKGDLDALEHRDEFRLKYAQDKGKSSYRDLDPKDKLEAALQYLQKYSHMSASDVAGYRSDMQGMSKSELTSYANDMWDMTGIGDVVSDWKSTVRDASG